MAVMSGLANLKTVGTFGSPPTSIFDPLPINTYVIQRDSIVYATGTYIKDIYWEQTDQLSNDCKMLIASDTPHLDGLGLQETQDRRFGQSNFVKNGTTLTIIGYGIYLHILEIDEDY